MLGRTADPQTYQWKDSDYILYALALGLGADPSRAVELAFAYERDLRIVPTFPTVLAWLLQPTFASLGAHPDFALHTGQSIEIHRLPALAETIAATGRVVAVADKGEGRGALIATRQEIIGLSDSRPIATLTTTCFARDMGGCGTAGVPLVAAHTAPPRAPDHLVTYDVRPEAALIYRLTGDRNALHADPHAARKAGFARPILHGLCTFGMICRALLERVTDWRPERITSQSARFTGIVFPGDALEMAIWLDGTEASVVATVADRGTVATGKATLRREPGVPDDINAA